MKTLIRGLYRFLPPSVLRALGSARWLEPLRRRLLRQPDGRYWVAEVQVAREYGDHVARFTIHVPINTSEKVRARGVENKLLRQSLALLGQRVGTRAPIILDVGTNFGYLSLVWATTVCKDQGAVHGFEPNPFVYQTFRESIRKNACENRLRLSHAAVGRSSGRVSIGLSDTTSNLDLAHGAREVIEVEMISLDDYAARENLPACDLLKIDVDGSEYDVLLGSLELIRRFKPILVVETNGEKTVVEFCRREGYTVLDMDLEPFDPNTASDTNLPANIFCI